MVNKICRITILAFMFGDIPKGIEHGYDDWDLENGIQYCEELIKYEGLTHEPMDNFDLKKYIEWAKLKLNDEKVEL